MMSPGTGSRRPEGYDVAADRAGADQLPEPSPSTAASTSST